jgi:hypothetical protein
MLVLRTAVEKSTCAKNCIALQTCERCLCLDLLLVKGLWPEHGVLARHTSRQCAVEFRAERELAHVVRLLAAEGVSLLDEALVFKAVKAGVP